MYMADTVIEVDNVSKRYELGKIGSGSLRRDLQHWWNKSVLKKKILFSMPIAQEVGLFGH